MEEALVEIVDFYNSHCKGGDMGAVALIQFHYVLDEDGELVPFIAPNGRLGLADIMERMSEFYSHTVCNDEGHVIAAGRQLSVVSLGQGGQVIVSISPMFTLAEIEAEYKNFRFRLKQILDEVDYTLVEAGFHPATTLEQLQAVPFKPYQEIRNFLGDEATSLLLGGGRCRVSFEYADEKDAVLKMRIASLLGPVFGFISENTPDYDQEGNDCPLLGMKLVREATELGGSVPGVFDEDFGFEKYGKWLLEKDVADGYGSASREMVLDLDLGPVLEICMADALPPAPMMGYIALLKGIFYSPTNLELLEIMLGLDRANSYNDSTADKFVAAICEQGSDAELCGKTVDSWVDTLFRMAGQALGTEAGYLEALQEYKGF